MNLEIKQSILMEHLNYVIKGISNKNMIPVLNCIKFELTEDGLYLLSTDNDIAIKSFITREDIEKINCCGEILVSGKYIYEIIKKLPNKIIKIEEVIDNKIIIETDKSSTNLNCNIPSEFPVLDLNDSKNPIAIKKQVFKNVIRQTAFASSNQESKPILTGINFKCDSNIMEISATDSYRVSKKEISLTESVKEAINIVIPTKNLNELIKLINDDDDEIYIHVFNNKVIFKFSNIIFMTRLINGSFPNLTALIPTDFLLEIEVNLHDFYESLDRASLFTNEEDKNTINLVTRENEIQISSNIPEIGNVEEIIEATKNNDKNIKIAFSSKYMMDAVRALECDRIVLMFSGEIKPIIIKNVEDDQLLELIVPIRTI